MTISPLDLLLSKLSKVQPHGNYQTALCPAHDDRQRSLSFRVGESGALVLKCHAGCAVPAIVAALELRMADLWPATGRNGHAAANGRKETRWEIRDEEGELQAVHVRVDGPDGKKFYWQGPTGVNGLQGRPCAALPLYGTHLLEGLPDGELVIVCEGEKATDAVRALGVSAVGTVSGASSCPENGPLRSLLRFRLALWPDNEDVGKKHMARIRQALRAMGNSPGMVRWKDAPEGGDAADFTGTLSDLMDLIEEPKTEPEPAAPGSDDSFHLTDLGNSERLVRAHGERIRHCSELGWLLYDGTRWERDMTGGIVQLMKATVREIYGEAAQQEQSGERKALADWAKKSESRDRIMAAIALAESDSTIAVKVSQLDTDPWLLNCRNGTIDLRTGTLQPNNREDLITKCCHAEYHPEIPWQAQAPTYDAFLNRVLPVDTVREFSKRAMGYSATGTTGEEVLFVPYGSGRNGKSKHLGAIEYTLGDYARSTRPQTFQQKVGEGIPNDVADLRGARFVPSYETEDGKRLDVALVKQLTGGDTIQARFLRQEFFTFKFLGKVWLAVNHKPIIRDTTNSIWERLKLFPYSVTIPLAERDKQLEAKLQAEADGILLWIVEGCLEWQRDGLGEPEEVSAATRSYREEMDPLSDFLTDRCVFSATAVVSNPDLWAAYEAWAKENGEGKLISRRSFTEELKRRGMIDGNSRRHGGRFWEGLGLLSAVADSDPATENDARNGSQQPFPYNPPSSISHEENSKTALQSVAPLRTPEPLELAADCPEREARLRVWERLCAAYLRDGTWLTFTFRGANKTVSVRDGAGWRTTLTKCDATWLPKIEAELK